MKSYPEASCCHCNQPLQFEVESKSKFEPGFDWLDVTPRRVLGSHKTECARCDRVLYVRGWQDESRTLVTVEHVYMTRYDCIAVPG